MAPAWVYAVAERLPRNHQRRGTRNATECRCSYYAHERADRYGAVRPRGRSIPLEPYGTPPATLSSPVGKYPWAETERAFAAIANHATGSEVDGISLEYTNPWTGGPVLPTTSCRVQRLVPGFRGAARRHTAATILHVVRGEGRTVINGEEFAWTDKDIFVVPSWASYQHIVDSSSDAVLFAYSNEPVVKALGLYREELLYPDRAGGA